MSYHFFVQLRVDLRAEYVPPSLKNDAQVPQVRGGLDSLIFQIEMLLPWLGIADEMHDFSVSAEPIIRGHLISRSYDFFCVTYCIKAGKYE